MTVPSWSSSTWPPPGLRPARRCPGGIASCPPCSTASAATCQPFTARRGAVLIAGHGSSRPTAWAWLCVPPLEHPERDAEQDGGEHHEDAGLDALEGPEPAGRLIGQVPPVAVRRHAGCNG